jgi:ElaB/YqjD/DUF883 family membrane-anchored ribosome-binding protein
MPMARDVPESAREGIKAAGGRGQDLAESIADRVEDALEGAQRQGRLARKELERRWKAVDRAGRENAFLMALAALGVGLLVGWLIGRERD